MNDKQMLKILRSDTIIGHLKEMNKLWWEILSASCDRDCTSCPIYQDMRCMAQYNIKTSLEIFGILRYYDLEEKERTMEDIK